MLTIDCPFCDRPVPAEDGQAVRCDACSVELPFADDAAVEVALAA